MDIVRKSTGRAIHVGVNAHLLSLVHSYRSAGINWYLYHLLRSLPEVHSQFRYTAFVGNGCHVVVPGIQSWVSSWPTHHPLVRMMWEQGVQPVAIRRLGLDLLHAPAFVGPLWSSCPVVLTIHDLSFLFFPQGFRPLNRWYLSLFTRLSVRRARRIIAVSQSTRRDLKRCYGLPSAQIDVIYNGVDPGFHPWSEAEVTAFRIVHGLPDRFLLFVGTLEPRKNVVRLIEAYARLSRPRPPLFLVGGTGWLYDEVFARIESLDLNDEVRHVGYVPAEDLSGWYNAAELFVYPSLYEGFGLPPLEAMACGTPVIASNSSSLPEVVGEAGILVDPANTEALTEALERVLRDSQLRETLRAKGLTQAQRFSWRKTAQGTVETYQRALLEKEGERHVPALP